MDTLIKKILKEYEQKKLNEPLEVGDVIIVIDVGNNPETYWGRGELLTPGKKFKVPTLYELYEVIEKGINKNHNEESFYKVLSLDDKKEHAKVKGFREGNNMEKLLYPSLDIWMKAEDSGILSEEIKQPSPPRIELNEGDKIVLVHIEKDKIKRGSTEMPELFTTYVVVSPLRESNNPNNRPPRAPRNVQGYLDYYYYLIVDKDVYDEVYKNGEYIRKTKEGAPLVTAWRMGRDKEEEKRRREWRSEEREERRNEKEGTEYAYREGYIGGARWGSEAKILYPVWDEFILRQD